MRQPSHLCFGYGERKYECRSCRENYSACYAIPPKGAIVKNFEKPNPDILQVGFFDGVRGLAHKVVLSAQSAGVTVKPVTGDEPIPVTEDVA